MMTSYFNLLKYAATGIASPDMTYYDRMRASTLMGGVVQTLTGIPPLTFKADGTPLISWNMKGNGSQTGTPTPDNPVMPTFCGVRTGNLVEVSNSNCVIYSTYNQFTIENDTVHISGNALFGFIVKCSPSTQYTVSSTRTGYNCDMRIREYSEKPSDWTTDFVTQSVSVGSSTESASFTTNSETKYILACFYGSNTATISDIMLNSGSTALPYEPFGWAEKITCAGQTVPVYLGQTQTVRRVKKLVLTGQEPWGFLSPTAYLQLSDIAVQSVCMCNMYEWNTTYSTDNTITTKRGAGTAIWIHDNRNAASKESFISFLADQYTNGTPVTVWYVLATEQTGIVNEPLCKIGDYADELRSEDAAVTIPTVRGQNVLTVDTPIQPSEMSITYKG